MRTVIDIIPSGQQRYLTSGDWIVEDNTLHVLASGQNDPRYESLIAIHEFVEAILCTYRGITTGQVDKFDFNFKGDGEPGDAPDCPYKREHSIAEIVERIVANELGVDFNKYIEEMK